MLRQQFSEDETDLMICNGVGVTRQRHNRGKSLTHKLAVARKSGMQTSSGKNAKASKDQGADAQSTNQSSR